jgi:hypothetical protein
MLQRCPKSFWQKPHQALLFVLERRLDGRLQQRPTVSGSTALPETILSRRQNFVFFRPVLQLPWLQIWDDLCSLPAPGNITIRR